jgi:hypothetical protein
MNTDRDTTRMVRSWLRVDENESANRVLDAVFDQLDMTPQRRALPWPARRPPEMSTFTKLGVVAAAFAIAAILGVSYFLRPNVGAPHIGASPTGPASGAPTPSVSSSPSSSGASSSEPPTSPVPPDALADRGSMQGPQSVTLRDIRLSFAVDAMSWESHGRPYISKSVRGPQGAEAVIYWATYPDGLSAEPCHSVLDPSTGESARELAAAVATAEGTELVSGPSDVMVGGRHAKLVIVTVRRDVGCDPGYFYTWNPFLWGALWPESLVDDTIRVWITDVEGTLVFIAGATHADAGSAVVREIEAIVGSMEFSTAR